MSPLGKNPFNAHIRECFTKESMKCFPLKAANHFSLHSLVRYQVVSSWTSSAYSFWTLSSTRPALQYSTFPRHHRSTWQSPTDHSPAFQHRTRFGQKNTNSTNIIWR